jgi:hypothetical protein
VADAIEQLKSFRKRREELEKEIKDTGKRLFKEAVETIFEEHPKLVAFSWTQYTPYFNDGDACTFSAHTDDPYIQFGDEEDLNEYHFRDSDRVCDGEEEVTDWRGRTVKQTKYKWVKRQVTEEESSKHAAHKALGEFLGLFCSDDYEAMFGDHVSVIVTKKDNGVKIETEGYSHD